MRITNLNDITSEMVDEILPAVKGVLKTLWEQKTGTTKTGKPYALQNGEILSGDKSIKVCFANRDPMPTHLRGQEIIIESQKTKHGLQGVKVSINEYKGQKNLELRITGSAVVTFPNATENAPEGVQEGEEDFSPSPLPPHHQNAPQPPKKAINPPSEAHQIQKTRFRMMQYANLYSIAWNAADFLSKSSGWDIATTKDVATSFFIQATRENLADNMPNKHALGAPEGKIEVVQESPKDERQENPEELEDLPEQDWDAVTEWKGVRINVAGHEYQGKSLAELDDDQLQILYQTFRPKNPTPEALAVMQGLVLWKHEAQSQPPINKKAKK